jgi:hypothetical protein
LDASPGAIGGSLATLAWRAGARDPGLQVARRIGDGLARVRDDLDRAQLVGAGPVAELAGALTPLQVHTVPSAPSAIWGLMPMMLPSGGQLAAGTFGWNFFTWTAILLAVVVPSPSEPLLNPQAHTKPVESSA